MALNLKSILCATLLLSSIIHADHEQPQQLSRTERFKACIRKNVTFIRNNMPTTKQMLAVAIPSGLIGMALGTQLPPRQGSNNSEEPLSPRTDLSGERQGPPIDINALENEASRLRAAAGTFEYGLNNIIQTCHNPKQHNNDLTRILPEISRQATRTLAAAKI